MLSITFVMAFKYYWVICNWPTNILLSYLLSFFKSVIKSECYAIDSDSSPNVMKTEEWDLGLCFRCSPLGQLYNHYVHSWYRLSSPASHPAPLLLVLCMKLLPLPSSHHWTLHKLFPLLGRSFPILITL